MTFWATVVAILGRLSRLPASLGSIRRLPIRARYQHFPAPEQPGIPSILG
jgi:hypothetical protein